MKHRKAWSRRIDEANRLVYNIDEKVLELIARKDANEDYVVDYLVDCYNTGFKSAMYNIKTHKPVKWLIVGVQYRREQSGDLMKKN